jgi:hypothetical protein
MNLVLDFWVRPYAARESCVLVFYDNFAHMKKIT